MEDLDEALNQNPDIVMLGGGNPGFIPEMQEYFYDRFAQILKKKKEFLQTIGVYDAPAGDKSFRKEIAGFLNDFWNWNITEEHVALTQGSQNSFFLLFNIFAGWNSGKKKLTKILFPVLPEYIGYENLPVQENTIAGIPGKKIPSHNPYFFRYTFDEEAIREILENEEIQAISFSNPANPTGKVYSSEEFRFLESLSYRFHLPVIVDLAYGGPFPNIVYEGEQRLPYSRNFIYVFSFSKTGLPGLRSGFLVASPEIIYLYGKIQAVHHLAPSRIASLLLKNTIENHEFYLMCRKFIRSYYKKRRDLAVEILTSRFTPEEIQIHEPEGAFFLWVEFPDLRISTYELYHILKKHNIIVVPGNFYFPGRKDLAENTRGIRISYSQSEDAITAGLMRLADTVKKFLPSF